MKPIAAANRIKSLDILRGFALLGIILVNVLGFNASFFDFGGFYRSLPDDFQSHFYSIYISLTADKFIFMFSFLYGYGIFMQYEKFVNSGANFTSFFGRRMGVLFLFGLAHLVFLWAGDILILYSIAGLVIMFFRRLSTKWLIMLAAIFYFFIGFWIILGVWIPVPDAMTSTCTECLEKAKDIYANGSYFEVMKLRFEEYFAFRNNNLFYYLTKIIGVSLTGFIVSKYKLHQSITSHRSKWLAIWVIFAAIGVILYFTHEGIINFESQYGDAMYILAYELMNFFVASSYLLLILIIASGAGAARVLKPIALMGRSALTNYLMQSLILSIIFYGWGFGFFGSTKVTVLVMIAVSVFCLQIVLNLIWARYFTQGPLEKLWRSLSYRNSKLEAKK